MLVYEQKKQQKSLKSDLKEIELSHEDLIKNLKQEQDKNITKLRQEYERNLKESQQKYERKMKQLRDDLELRRKNEIHEIEGIVFVAPFAETYLGIERKNAHINELMKKHDKAFQEIKVYYNDITLNNLELIKSLKVRTNSFHSIMLTLYRNKLKNCVRKTKRARNYSRR